MRMVESTNMVVVSLRALGFQELVVPLMHHAERQIDVISDISDCPPGKDTSGCAGGVDRCIARTGKMNSSSGICVLLPKLFIGSTTKAQRFFGALRHL
jgi:hypothetical protein